MRRERITGIPNEQIRLTADEDLEPGEPILGQFAAHRALQLRENHRDIIPSDVS
jgi:hypothetical protein